MITRYKNEKTLFTIAAVISSIFWLALLVGTFGLLLVYLLLGYIAYLFAHSGFISYLKGDGVRVSAHQFPELQRQVEECCRKVGLDAVPEVYLLRTDLFNALATKFLGRHFVVLFTDVVDALEGQPGALNFYIGHELGHIRSKHLVWGWFTAPAMVLPLLGAALRRAQEYSCDRYGVACCDTDRDMLAALGAMAAGSTRWRSFDALAFAAQGQGSPGFWSSFHELTADYPWLSKRVASAIAQKQQSEPQFAPRNLAAVLLALLVPRFPMAGGAASALIAVAMIGILAAVALPAYQDYTVRAVAAEALNAATEVRQRASEYYQLNQAWPETLTGLGYEQAPITDPANRYTIDIYSDGAIGIDVSHVARGEGQYIVLSPSVSESGEISWSCSGQNLPAKFLPGSCK